MSTTTDDIKFGGPLPTFLRHDGFNDLIPDPRPFWNYRIPAATKEDFETTGEIGKRQYKRVSKEAFISGLYTRTLWQI